MQNGKPIVTPQEDSLHTTAILDCAHVRARSRANAGAAETTNPQMPVHEMTTLVQRTGRSEGEKA